MIDFNRCKRFFNRNGISLFYQSDQTNEVERLRTICDRDESIVQWNVQPAEKINILHLVYLITLKQLMLYGFNCIIMMFDNTCKQEQENLSARSERNIEFYINFLSDAGNIEVIYESDISKNIKHADFIRMMSGIAEKLDKNAKIGHKKAVETINEVSYGKYVESHMLLAGKQDKKNIWENTETGMLGDSYNPPLIAFYEVLCGNNGKPLSSQHSKNSYDQDNYKTSSDEIVNIFGIADGDATRKNEYNFAKLIDKHIFEPYKALLPSNEAADFYEKKPYEKLDTVFLTGETSQKKR